MRKLHLVIIDPQNSFCKEVPADQQAVLHDGELCVPNAWDDMVRLASMIDRVGNKFADIHVTLDSHQLLHIANTVFWKNDQGKNPAPFTSIYLDGDKIVGKDLSGNVEPLTTILPSLYNRAKEYIKSLDKGGKYQLTAWPPHCIVGSVGAAVVAPLFESLLRWSLHNYSTIDWVTKGSNPFSEHYGAVAAEVPDPNDPSTQLNTDFIKTLNEADEVVFAGEALSHCLKTTCEQICDSFADDSFIKKCVLLTDASSPVPFFEQNAKDFVDNMVKRGMRLSTTVDYLS